MRRILLTTFLMVSLALTAAVGAAAMPMYRIAVGPQGSPYHTAGGFLEWWLDLPILRAETSGDDESLAFVQRGLVEFAIVNVSSLRASAEDPASTPFRVISYLRFDDGRNGLHALITHRAQPETLAYQMARELHALQSNEFAADAGWQPVAISKLQEDELSAPFHPGALQFLNDVEAERFQSPISPGGIEVTFPQLSLSVLTAQEDWSPDRYEVVESINQAIRAKGISMAVELAEWGSAWGDYEVHLDQQGLLSVSMTYAGYAMMAAHPSHLKGSVTASLETGRVYSLADLFDAERYVDVLSARVAREVEADEVFSAYSAFEGIRPDHDFYLTPEGLVLYFQVYEIAPYAYGFPHFFIPYEEIREIIPAASPLARLLPSNTVE